MFAHVEAVIGREEDVRVLQLAVLLQQAHQVGHHFIHRLHGLHPQAEERIGFFGFEQPAGLPQLPNDGGFVAYVFFMKRGLFGVGHVCPPVQVTGGGRAGPVRRIDREEGEERLPGLDALADEGLGVPVEDIRAVIFRLL